MFFGKFDITKFCDKNCRPISDKQTATNAKGVREISSGNDPTMTKAMRYAMNVRNAKPKMVNVGVWLANHPK